MEFFFFEFFGFYQALLLAANKESTKRKLWKATTLVTRFVASFCLNFGQFKRRTSSKLQASFKRTEKPTTRV